MTAGPTEVADEEDAFDIDIFSIKEELMGLAFVPRLSERELARTERWDKHMIERGGVL